MEISEEVECHYCGESFSVKIDTSGGPHSLTIDCEVCCRPMQLEIDCAVGEVYSVNVQG